MQSQCGLRCGQGRTGRAIGRLRRSDAAGSVRVSHLGRQARRCWAQAGGQTRGVSYAARARIRRTTSRFAWRCVSPICAASGRSGSSSRRCLPQVAIWARRFSGSPCRAAARINTSSRTITKRLDETLRRNDAIRPAEPFWGCSMLDPGARGIAGIGHQQCFGSGRWRAATEHQLHCAEPCREMTKAVAGVDFRERRKR